MKRIKDLDSVKLNNTIILLGKFDGFHLGHQRLLSKALSLKTEYSAEHPEKEPLQVVIFTFDVHPGQILSAAENSQPLVQTIQTRQERFMGQAFDGVDYLIEFPFTRETMSMEPEQFVDDILTDRLGVKIIVCGDDFRFGKNRRGDVRMLCELCKDKGFEVCVVPKVTIRMKDARGEDTEQEVSSTRIKDEIREGHMEQAAAMLGRAFEITGKVIPGKKLGRTIGFPTANLLPPDDQVLPPDGVYAAKITICGTSEVYAGMTNIGRRPTFQDGEHRTIETFLFDFSGNLYDRTISVAFCHFVRPERTFKGIEQLTEQIHQDQEKIKAYFQKNTIYHVNNK